MNEPSSPHSRVPGQCGATQYPRERAPGLHKRRRSSHKHRRRIREPSPPRRCESHGLVESRSMRISEASCTSSTYHGGVMREGGRVSRNPLVRSTRGGTAWCVFTKESAAPPPTPPPPGHFPFCCGACDNPGTQMHMYVASTSLAQICGNPGTFSHHGAHHGTELEVDAPRKSCHARQTAVIRVAWPPLSG